ncbi:imidazole glycerol phosphate synthase subunit HisF [Nostoc ellipsosporum NOK]|uniref:AglZ/HisF2 family acetamidino modification protein n=1 Tax=Sphingomonas sp. IBVSS2 TaxID=1985172 RepID=UPI000A2E6E83|nr:AglZ/HisF2 family acetamidino modification protein [Sphingomonas sp. IBVSS2]MDF2384380.1 imidazole glycerol phosphate synthase subunit HisF [Nostoc ellipsosporum NOK]OSZ68488.1 imidazole glycerol phosphate synthase subunit HisF [Sphingomonas sp. IBVSS2]
MLRARVVPCLLVRNGGLVKTRRFGDDKYVGDPINAVRIFNEKEVDELIVADIDATVKGAEPNYAMIENLAAECRMPLCYGGGVTSAEQAKRIMDLGVEKISISAAAIERPELISEIARQVGRQSVVVVLDVKKKTFGGHQLRTHNGNRAVKLDPVEFARRAEALGAGEIVINSIDHDGMMDGYDLALARQVRAAVEVPMTILGGAGSLADMEAAVRALGTVGVAAGSFFVFKGTYRAVLISYLSSEQRRALQEQVAA